MKALVVGGTGPTGPYIVNGLRERGYDVAIFHRGTHEIPEIPDDVEHIHGDPHFLETIESSLDGRTFDLAIATYGRIRFLAQALRPRAGRFISVGGVASYRGYLEPDRLHPPGMVVPSTEDAAVVDDEDEHRFSYLIAQTEQTILETIPTATHFRYPYVYGPRQLIPREWSILRRCLDNRTHLILPDAGLNLTTHGYAENLAHSVLLAVDHSDVAAGQIYNCGDEQQLTLRQIAQLIAESAGHEFSFVDLPNEFARPAYPYCAEETTYHRVMDISKIKSELGYADIHPARVAVGLTVDWLLANRPEPGGELEQRLQDPFDYDGEDRLIDCWRDARERLAAVPLETPERRAHPYAHPKKPGERDHRNR